MQYKHTELLRKESVRLLNQQISLLKSIQATNGLLKEPNSEQMQSLDTVRAHQEIEVLLGELEKLECLDTVIAVVGTMKSGKSTTNNAIVGLEILPNRNRPMTALPTLIRHVPGQKLPVLRFDNCKALNAVVNAIEIKLNTVEGSQLLSESDLREDLERVAEAVKGGYRVLPQYENESGIFDFLKGLNDLVRLATALGVNFPFDAFKGMSELPVIEVEFQHLIEAAGVNGRLSLLDTPGPNEEGQFALKSIMKDQLRRASGVIAVLDYTQLKSESDADVRRELLEIAEMARGRLSVWVNKFDQEDRNSDGKDKVKALVANELLKGKVREDDVYPISSRYAYLANRARTEVAKNGSLPDATAHPWVEDFAEKGLGLRWHKYIDDANKVKDAIDGLWEESLFEIPLERVIKSAHNQAALLAIDSAASKLVSIGERISNFLGVRETALHKSAEELKSYIENLRSQQGRVDGLESTFRAQLDKFTNSLKSDLGKLTSTASDSLGKALENYFLTGRREAYDEARVDLNEEPSSAVIPSDGFWFFLRIFNNEWRRSSRSKKYRDPDFDPNSPKIEFRDKAKAIELIEKIKESINQEYEKINNAMLSAMEAIHKSIENESVMLEQDAKLILDEISSHMQEKGFDLKLRLPPRRALSVKVDNQKILEDMVEKESRTTPRSRRKSSAWGTICGWLGTEEWGWESYSHTADYFVIDIKKIQSEVMQSSKMVFKNAESAIQDNVVAPIDSSCSEFFAALKRVIDEVRGDLLQGLADGNRSKREQDDLVGQLMELKRESSETVGDLIYLEQDSKAILAANGTDRGCSFFREGVAV